MSPSQLQPLLWPIRHKHVIGFHHVVMAYLNLSVSFVTVNIYKSYHYIYPEFFMDSNYVATAKPFCENNLQPDSICE